MSRIRKATNVGRRTRGRMCTGKARMSSSEAKEAVDRRVAWGAYRESLNTYPCPWCHTWHVGTRNQALHQGRRRR